MANSRITRQPPPQDDESRTTRDQPTGDVGSSTSNQVEPERVAQRAYELFQMRGGEAGRDQEDWFAAERELKGAGE
jgi:Protein of unknown function (DUF2934)